MEVFVFGNRDSILQSSSLSRNGGGERVWFVTSYDSKYSQFCCDICLQMMNLVPDNILGNNLNFVNISRFCLCLWKNSSMRNTRSQQKKQCSPFHRTGQNKRHLPTLGPARPSPHCHPPESRSTPLPAASAPQLPLLTQGCNHGFSLCAYTILRFASLTSCSSLTFFFFLLFSFVLLRW